MKRYGNPDVIVTDMFRFYGAAMKVIGNAGRRETGHWKDDKAENSHLPFRRRERAMLRFRQMRCLQQFTTVQAPVHNHFNQERHLYTRACLKLNRTAALAGSRCLGAAWGGLHSPRNDWFALVCWCGRLHPNEIAMCRAGAVWHQQWEGAIHRTITPLGIDLAKSVFQLHGGRCCGGCSAEEAATRSGSHFIGKLEPCLIGMEAYATSHYRAREIEALGHVPKMRSSHLRRALVVGATSATRRAPTTDTRSGVWVRSLPERKPTRRVTVAITNKTARTVWALLAKEEDYKAIGNLNAGERQRRLTSPR